MELDGAVEVNLTENDDVMDVGVKHKLRKQRTMGENPKKLARLMLNKNSYSMKSIGARKSNLVIKSKDVSPLDRS